MPVPSYEAFPMGIPFPWTSVVLTHNNCCWGPLWKQGILHYSFCRGPL